MTKAQYIITGCIVVGVIGLFFLIKNLFSPGKSTNDSLVKQLLATKDSVIASKNENIVLHERIIEEIDRANDVLQSRDSVLNAHYRENELRIQKLNETINKIPSRITNLSNHPDSIARAFSDF